MRIAIYTSLAINYLAKARVMARTVKNVNPSIDVVALICDRFPDTIDPAGEPFDDIWMVDEYPTKSINQWIFRHNIMELATAVKGWALRRLLEAGYDYVMYLDPDCWVMEDPAQIIEQLTPEYSVGVVPHTTRPADSVEEIRVVETSSLRHGIYNLGFLIVRNNENGHKLANWWAERLDQYCIDDFKSGLFTDQRWFDLAVGYFDFIKVLRHRGIDVASWNIGQRILGRVGDGYLIDGDPLIFYHFSGVGPTGVHRWVRDKFAPSNSLAAEIEFRYERLIRDQGQQQLQNIVPYFDMYSDGTRINNVHRKLLRERPDLAQQFPNPFDVTSLQNFRNIATHNGLRTMSSTSSSHADPAASGRSHSDLPPDGKWVDAMARRLFDEPYCKLMIRSTEIDGDKLWTAFVRRGWSKDNVFNRFFDVEYYLLMVGTVPLASHPTPLHHFVAVGVPRKISPNWIYDEGYYLQHNEDVADAVRRGDLLCGFEHFSRHGAGEGRSGCAFFNERRYLELNQDVSETVASGGCRSGELHYLRHGRKEGRPFR